MKSLPQDLGGDVVVHWHQPFDETGQELTVRHRRPDTGAPCRTVVPLEPGAHSMTSWTPLTVTPAVTCATCGWSRSLTDGQVV